VTPHPRFEKLDESQQKAILDAAAAEFAREGFERASVNRIIAAADLSKGALYYYFNGKEDLYAAVMNDVLDRVVEAVADIPEPTDAEAYWRMLMQGLDRLNTVFFHDTVLADLGRGLYQRGGGDPAYDAILERSGRWIRDLVEMGQRLGAVRTDVPLGLLAEAVTGMLVAMDRWFVMALENEPPEELLALAPKTIELARDLLAPKPDKSHAVEEET
jgi:AcrR family transcriptional regulator